MNIKEIAEKINAHLKRWESDPSINKVKDYRGMKLQPYYNAGAWAGGRWVNIQYVSYQRPSTLTKMDAEAYLARIESGFVGSHFKKT